MLIEMAQEENSLQKCSLQQAALSLQSTINLCFFLIGFLSAFFFPMTGTLCCCSPGGQPAFELAAVLLTREIQR